MCSIHDMCFHSILLLLRQLGSRNRVYNHLQCPSKKWWWAVNHMCKLCTVATRCHYVKCYQVILVEPLALTAYYLLYLNRVQLLCHCHCGKWYQCYYYNHWHWSHTILFTWIMCTSHVPLLCYCRCGKCYQMLLAKEWCLHTNMPRHANMSPSCLLTCSAAQPKRMDNIPSMMTTAVLHPPLASCE